MPEFDFSTLITDRSPADLEALRDLLATPMADWTAEPLWDQGNKVELTALVNYPTMKANESIAALIFHLDGNKGNEYVVSGNSTSSEKTVTIENPFIHNTTQALAAARLILSCYGGNLIETSGRGDPSSEIGDVDTIWLDESTATTARRKYQTFTFQNGVMQGCASKLLQADGSYLFEEFAVIGQSGTWTATCGDPGPRLPAWTRGSTWRTWTPRPCQRGRAACGGGPFRRSCQRRIPCPRCAAHPGGSSPGCSMSSCCSRCCLSECAWRDTMRTAPMSLPWAWAPLSCWGCWRP